MKINSILCCGTTCPTSSKNRIGKFNYQTKMLLHEPQQDTIAFKSKALKGAGIGAVFGAGAIGALSLLTGGLATPIACAVYVGTFGTVGGIVGKAADDLDKKDKDDRAA